MNTMKVTCPSCSVHIRIDQEVLAALDGKTHFACPSCQAEVAVPSRTPDRASAFRGLNRNLLILGSVALLVLGGLGFYLASQKSGDTTNTTQNIRNEIINNSYFQSLIATGVTTMKDLDAVSAIRPYGDGFIGISSEPLDWQQANDLAKRTGSVVLSADIAAAAGNQELVSWLTSTFPQETGSPLWMTTEGSPSVLASAEVLAVSGTDGVRRVLLRWHPSIQSQTDIPASATKGKPFVNSLGMRFVPVPDTNVLFCIHETRRQDYAKYAKSVIGADTYWQVVERDGIPSGHEDDHPVAGVSWGDAGEFCKWLSEKEGRTYRVPTDREWSIAVGIGELEPPTYSGTDKIPQVPGHFPWESQLPVRVDQKIGNYADSTWRETYPAASYIENYRDGYATTAPVMSFSPNRLGIYDLGGNVQEWVEDWAYRGNVYKILRGGAFSSNRFDLDLLSSERNGQVPYIRWNDIGFRVVLEANVDVSLLPQAPNILEDPPNVSKRVVDLMPLVDLSRDASNGIWSKTEEGLSMAYQENIQPRIQFPHPIATDEYDYEIEISYPITGMEHRIGFPVPGHRMEWAMNVFSYTETPTYFFVDLDGVPAANAKEAYVRLPQLKQGSRHRTVVKVRKGEVAAFFDGTQVVRWKGDTRRFNRPARAVRDERFPDFFIWNGGVVIHEAKIIEFVPK